MNRKQTSNIEHPTSNFERSAFGLRWMLDVRCSMFDVPKLDRQGQGEGWSLARQARMWMNTLLVVGACLLSAFRSAAQDPVDNVVVVLDCSGSMAAALPGSNLDKMTAAKNALKQVLQTVPPSTHIGLLVFSARDVKDDWVYPLGPRDDAKLNQAIDPLQPSGGTPLGASLKKGADRLLEARTKQFGYGTFRLLVVTDGEAGDKELVERHTPEIVARGITVDVIGVGMSQRHTLATKVHSYRSANDPASLKRPATAARELLSILKSVLQETTRAHPEVCTDGRLS